MASRPAKPVPRAMATQMRRDMLRKGARGLSKQLYQTDRSLSIAMKRERDALLAELDTEAASNPSAVALVDTIVRTRVLLDTVDAVLMQLGAGIVNRRKRVAYPLLQQRQSLADSLVQHLKAFHELRFGVELEKRIAALEDGRTINGDVERS